VNSFTLSGPKKIVKEQEGFMCDVTQKPFKVGDTYQVYTFIKEGHTDRKALVNSQGASYLIAKEDRKNG